MNEVRLSGKMKVRKSFPPRAGKKALVFGSIKTDAGIFDVKAFDKAAMDFGNAHELEVSIVGRLAIDKDKKDGVWRTVVVVEKVIATETDEGHDLGRDDRPF